MTQWGEMLQPVIGITKPRKKDFKSDEKTLREPVLGNLLVLHAQRLHDLPLVFSGPCFGRSFALLSLRLVLDNHLGKQLG